MSQAEANYKGLNSESSLFKSVFAVRVRDVELPLPPAALERLQHSPYHAAQKPLRAAGEGLPAPRLLAVEGPDASPSSRPPVLLHAQGGVGNATLKPAQRGDRRKVGCSHMGGGDVHPGEGGSETGGRSLSGWLPQAQRMEGGLGAPPPFALPHFLALSPSVEDQRCPSSPRSSTPPCTPGDLLPRARSTWTRAGRE